MGVAFIPSPADLGLSELGDRLLIEKMASFPRDETVLLMAALSQMLNWFGEFNSSLQREGAKVYLRDGPRERALSFLNSYANGAIVTYEAAVRLALLAMSHGSETREISDAEVSELVSLLPEVQARLSRLETMEDESLVRGTPEYYEDVALTLFLSANAPGQLSPYRTMLTAVTLGALAVRSLPRHLKAKKRRAVDAALVSRVGGNLEELHAAAVHVCNHFIFGERQLEAGKQPQHFVRLDELRSMGHRLGSLGAAVAEAACVAEFPADLSLADAVGPKACLPPPVRWRPFYRVGREPNALACWDVRLLHAMLGGMFPEWVNPLLGSGLADSLGQAWDHAVEDALDEMVRPFIPSWSRPSVSGTNCDRLFTDGHDLFLVEIKNVRPSPSLLASPSVPSLRAWLKRKFYEEAGFPQVYATLAKLVGNRSRIGGRRVVKYRCVWPVIVSWTRASGHTVVTDLLARIDSEVGRPDLGVMAERTMPPLLLDYDDLLHVATLMPALQETDAGLGDAIRAFLARRADRPFTLGTFIANQLGNPVFPQEATNTMEVALEAVRELGNRLREEPAAATTRPPSHG